MIYYESLFSSFAVDAMRGSECISIGEWKQLKSFPGLIENRITETMDVMIQLNEFIGSRILITLVLAAHD